MLLLPLRPLFPWIHISMRCHPFLKHRHWVSWIVQLVKSSEPATGSLGTLQGAWECRCPTSGACRGHDELSSRLHRIWRWFYDGFYLWFPLESHNPHLFFRMFFFPPPPHHHHHHHHHHRHHHPHHHHPHHHTLSFHFPTLWHVWGLCFPSFAVRTPRNQDAVEAPDDLGFMEATLQGETLQRLFYSWPFW